MFCTQYRELQRRCDSKRRIMSHFMRYKPLDWQADPSARSFAKETQTEILKLPLRWICINETVLSASENLIGLPDRWRMLKRKSRAETESMRANNMNRKT